MPANYADAIIETVPRAPPRAGWRAAGEAGDRRVLRRVPRRARRRRKASCFTSSGNGQWDIPGLRSLLEEVLPKNARVRRFQGRHTFPKIGKKTMLLNARRVARRRTAKP